MLNVEGMNSIDFIKRLSKAKQPFDILRFSILRFCGSLLKTLNLGTFSSLAADVAQLVEQLIRNQQASGSNPLVGSNIILFFPTLKFFRRL